jgi:magnesium transporter
MSESKFYHFSESGLFYNVTSLKDAIDASAEGGFIWLNYFNPMKDELSALVDTIGIHPLSVEDCLDEKQVPKIEQFNNNTFIIFNSLIYIDKTLFVDEINLIIGKNFLVTVSGHNSDDRKPLGNIEKVVMNDISNARKGPEYLMQIVLDFIVDEKFEAFETLEEELQNAEDGVLENPSHFNPGNLMQLRKYLLNLRKSIYHEREIMIKICRLDCPFVTEKSIFHYRDIYDHLSRFFELTETYREIVTNLMELYTSLLNNMMTKMSNEMNASVKRLTLITTVFMPLTLLASIGGMSEWSMMTGPSNWKISYPLFFLGMIVIAIVNYYLFKRLEKKDIQRRDLFNAT